MNVSLDWVKSPGVKKNEIIKTRQSDSTARLSFCRQFLKQSVLRKQIKEREEYMREFTSINSKLDYPRNRPKFINLSIFTKPYVCVLSFPPKMVSVECYRLLD